MGQRSGTLRPTGPATSEVVDPPVIARASGTADLGDKVTVRLTAVDPEAGRASFVVA